MNRMLTWGKWLLIGTLIFHVLNANYVVNQYAARWRAWRSRLSG